MTLDSPDAPVVPLSVELEFLDAYLRIQKERFGDRLRVDVDIDNRTLSAAVPNLILQPLVENSIRHGIGSDPGTGIIAIRTWLEEGMLVVQVQDNGAGIADGDTTAEGVGLANIRARLAQLYPSAHAFTLGAGSTGGTIATITIPFQLVSAAESAGVRGGDPGGGQARNAGESKSGGQEP
jgi:LytS/YehU family sensor histidine kinase